MLMLGINIGEDCPKKIFTVIIFLLLRWPNIDIHSRDLEINQSWLKLITLIHGSRRNWALNLVQLVLPWFHHLQLFVTRLEKSKGKYDQRYFLFPNIHANLISSNGLWNLMALLHYQDQFHGEHINLLFCFYVITIQNIFLSVYCLLWFKDFLDAWT